MQKTDAHAKVQALAHWETLVQAGTPEAVAEIEKQGIKFRNVPEDAMIAALDCLSRIGTPEAVDVIQRYYFCKQVLKDTSGEAVVRTMASVQFAALLSLPSEEVARAEFFQQVDSYRGFNLHGYVSYHEGQMYPDIEAALGMVKSPCADRIAVDLAKTRPDFAGYARAYLVTREPADSENIQRLEAVLRERVAEGLKGLRDESISGYVTRIVRDVAPFAPIDTMSTLCGIRFDLDFDGKGKCAVNTGIYDILKAHPQHQKELIGTVIEAQHQRGRPYDGLAKYRAEQKGTENEVPSQCAVIDAFAGLPYAGGIRDTIKAYPADHVLVDYGLRALISMNDHPYEIRSLVRGHCPEKAGDVMRLYLEHAAEKPSSYTAARRIANMGTCSDRDEFIGHCVANPSYDSIRQIRHLNIADAVAARILLDVFAHPTAVKEVGQMAKFCPDIAIGALLDARETKLEAGQNDVRLYDDVIRDAVSQLVTPQKLKDLADGQQRSVMQFTFDRVARTEIIDARAAFGAAVGLLQAEQAHEQAIDKLAAACGLAKREVK